VFGHPPIEAPHGAMCPDVLTLFSQHLEGEIDPSVCATMEAHLALGWVECVDGSRQGGRQFPIGGGLFGARRRIGKALSASGSLCVERLFARGRKFTPAPLLDAEPAGDGVQPAGDRRVAAEVAQGTGHRNEALLRDLAGVVHIAAHPKAKPIEMRLIPDEQRLERCGVSLACGRQQFVIGRRPSRGSGWNIRTHW
jgi:hypothetical protein